MSDAAETRTASDGPVGSICDSEVLSVTRRAIQWAREREYAGWDPYDGLNSPLLSAAGAVPLTRLVGLHLVNRAPVNLRPLVGVPKERNPKGVALFARTLLYLYELSGTERYLTEAESLLEWLLDVRASSYDGSAWGYNFDWQNGTKFFLKAYEPCVVVSVFCGKAFLHHWRVTGEEWTLRIAREVGEFITSELNIERVAGHRAYTYTPHDEFVVVNANALAASYLAHVDAVRPTDAFRRRADELVAFVVDVQTDAGAWYYAVPSGDSHLTHDNFHTGYVVESLRDYTQVRSAAPGAERAYEQGLAFYRSNLFENGGAPKFDHESSFPRDVHSSAQGIRTFAAEKELVDMSRDVLDWAVENFFDEEGYFYRRKGRYLTDRTPYIRWSQAWMCFALASYLYFTESERPFPDVVP